MKKTIYAINIASLPIEVKKNRGKTEIKVSGGFIKEFEIKSIDPETEEEVKEVVSIHEHISFNYLEKNGKVKCI